MNLWTGDTAATIHRAPPPWRLHVAARESEWSKYRIVPPLLRLESLTGQPLPPPSPIQSRFCAKTSASPMNGRYYVN